MEQIRRYRLSRPRLTFVITNPSFHRLTLSGKKIITRRGRLQRDCETVRARRACACNSQAQLRLQSALEGRVGQFRIAQSLSRRGVSILLSDPTPNSRKNTTFLQRRGTPGWIKNCFLASRNAPAGPVRVALGVFIRSGGYRGWNNNRCRRSGGRPPLPVTLSRVVAARIEDCVISR